MMWYFFIFFVFFNFVFLYFFMPVNMVWLLEWDLAFSISSFKVTFIWDFYASLFILCVLLITSMIFFFSKYYMDSEKSITGFMALLSFFVISMVLLVVSPNLMMLLLGWDGLGLTSYLLIIYYFSVSSSVAGMLTFLVNRLGDIFFLFSIVYLSIFWEREFYEVKTLDLTIFFFMFLAFITKSAQVPFSSWLPAAMAAPTPVSSLVHSSTLVTAGIFLTIRFFEVFRIFSGTLFVVALFTLILAGVMANLEWDLKKVIALSTLSQLGFMMSSISLGLVVFGFFHLVSHALFKASLFMCSGLFIHSGDSSQEFRNSSNFLKSSPLVAAAVLVCLICLCGFPFTTGFFSKDFILDGTYFSFFSFLIFIIGVLLTFIYSLRLSVYLFLSPVLTHWKMFLFYENIYYMMFPIWILILTSVFGGLFLFEFFFSISFVLVGAVGWKVLYFSSIFLVVGLWGAFSFVLVPFQTKKYFLSTMWFLSFLLSYRFSFAFFSFCKKIFMWGDSGFLEFYGAQGLKTYILIFSMSLMRHIYMFYFFLSAFIIFLMLL